MSVKKLRRIQFGLEATKGTAVPATGIWRGTGVLDDQREVTFPEEDVGYLSGLDRSYIAKIAAQIALDDAPFTFEQGPIPFAIGLDDVISGVADGVGTGKIYTYALATTSDPGFKTITVEGGDDQQAEEMEYGFASEIVLRGAAGEAWMQRATIMGRQAQNTTFTAAPAIPTVEEILFSKTHLYSDAVAGTPGTTELSNTLLEAEITIRTGLIPVLVAHGALYFAFAKRATPEVIANITFEHDASAVAEKTNWRNQVSRILQLKCEGSALGTPGTSYSNKTFIANLVGRWERFEPIDERDGNDVIRGSFRARYNATAAMAAQFILVNEEAAILS